MIQLTAYMLNKFAKPCAENIPSKSLLCYWNVRTERPLEILRPTDRGIPYTMMSVYIEGRNQTIEMSSYSLKMHTNYSED